MNLCLDTATNNIKRVKIISVFFFMTELQAAVLIMNIKPALGHYV